MGKKRKGGGGNRKGSAFERKLCVALSKWVSLGKRKDLFWRTAMSGGRATVMRRKGEDIRQSGDICAVAPEGHPFTDKWYVEAKFYKDIQLQHWLLTGKGKIQQWWDKACEEADHHMRTPFVVLKENGTPPLLLVPPGYMDFRFGRPLFRVSKKDRDIEVYNFEALLAIPYILKPKRLRLRQ